MMRHLASVMAVAMCVGGCHTMNKIREAPPDHSRTLSGGAEKMAECTRDAMRNQKHVAHTQFRKDSQLNIAFIVSGKDVTEPLYEVTFRPIDDQSTIVEVRTAADRKAEEDEVWALVRGCANR